MVSWSLSFACQGSCFVLASYLGIVRRVEFGMWSVDCWSISLCLSGLLFHLTFYNLG